MSKYSNEQVIDCIEKGITWGGWSDYQKEIMFQAISSLKEFIKYEKLGTPEYITAQLSKLAELEKIQCQNCSRHRISKDNVLWCACSGGLDSMIKPASFCSYFELKEEENNVK